MITWLQAALSWSLPGELVNMRSYALSVPHPLTPTQQIIPESAWLSVVNRSPATYLRYWRVNAQVYGQRSARAHHLQLRL